MRAITSYAVLASVLGALMLCDAASLRSPPLLSLRGGAGRRKHKAVHLHDLARNDSQNEYFAGGQDEEGRGSATVLIYPDEPAADDNTTATAEAAPKEKTTAFKGSGRRL